MMSQSLQSHTPYRTQNFLSKWAPTTLDGIYPALQAEHLPSGSVEPSLEDMRASRDQYLSKAFQAIFDLESDNPAATFLAGSKTIISWPQISP